MYLYSLSSTTHLIIQPLNYRYVHTMDFDVYSASESASKFTRNPQCGKKKEVTRKFFDVESAQIPHRANKT